jgi:hypothetical protein
VNYEQYRLRAVILSCHFLFNFLRHLLHTLYLKGTKEGIHFHFPLPHHTTHLITSDFTMQNRDNFSSFQNISIGYGAQSNSHSNGKVSLASGVKWHGYEFEYPPPSTAELKNTWSYISIPILPPWCSA